MFTAIAVLDIKEEYLKLHRLERSPSVFLHRYGFEGTLLSIYGFDRKPLHCSEAYCHYKSPKKFLEEMDIVGAEFWIDFLVLFSFFIILRTIGYFVLRWKLKAER